MRQAILHYFWNSIYVHLHFYAKKSNLGPHIVTKYDCLPRLRPRKIFHLDDHRVPKFCPLTVLWLGFVLAPVSGLVSRQESVLVSRQESGLVSRQESGLVLAPDHLRQAKTMHSESFEGLSPKQHVP